jgi:hypothetical protein
MSTATTTAPATTALGTPCARSWSEEWIATVNATETQLNRRLRPRHSPDRRSPHPVFRIHLRTASPLLRALWRGPDRATSDF